MKTVLVPYLNFNGSTAEAMKFYKSVLGGTLKMTTFGEAGAAMKPKDKDLTMHAELISDDIVFYASDGPPGQKIKFGDNISMSIVGADDAKITGYFKKLAKGGKITMKLAKQSWGDKFGMLVDKFGVQWMVNISAPKKK